MVPRARDYKESRMNSSLICDNALNEALILGGTHVFV
jgi:hypothetical protein